jgi:hypothetical protein
MKYNRYGELQIDKKEVLVHRKKIENNLHALISKKIVDNAQQYR